MTFARLQARRSITYADEFERTLDLLCASSQTMKPEKAVELLRTTIATCQDFTTQIRFFYMTWTRSRFGPTKWLPTSAFVRESLE